MTTKMLKNLFLVKKKKILKKKVEVFETRGGSAGDI
jgi:hypothetical protein